MTITVGKRTVNRRNGPHLSARHASAQPSIFAWLRKPDPLLRLTVAGFIIGFAWLIRFIGITKNYDVFIDEITYTRIADNLATGHGLTLYGVPFDLHPPAAFALYGLMIKGFGLNGSIIHIIFALRVFVALLGSISCGIVFLLVASVSNWRAGIVAATIAALDPFEIFYDSRVMLEAPAQLANITAVILIVWSMRTKSRAGSWALTVSGGVAAGFSICTKEYFGLALALTVFLSLITSWTIERKKALTILAVMSCSFSLSEALVIESGGFQSWWNQITSGVQRLIGSKQISGFNSSTVHVSLIARVAANTTHYGITYIILVSGAAAGMLQVVAVLRRYREWEGRAGGVERGRLFVALWAVSSAAYLFYATVFGTLEEQIYYLLFLPSLCTLAISISSALPRSKPIWRRIAVAIIAIVVVFDSAVWIGIHQRSDNEYSQLTAWTPEHLRPGSTVAVTEYTAQFLLKNVVLGQWATVPALIKHHVNYVLLSTSLVKQGYGIGTPQFEHYLQTHATVVFRATGPSEGQLILYDVSSITGARS